MKMIELKSVVNPAYRVIKAGDDGFAYKSLNGLTIIQSLNIEADGKTWIHTSFSRRSRMPEYADIERVKRDFVGPENKAIMVLPDKQHHVNIHPFCLHLFHCLDGDGLPEFSAMGSL